MNWSSNVTEPVQDSVKDVVTFCRENEHSKLYKDLPNFSGTDLISWVKEVEPTGRSTLMKNKGALRHFPDEEVRFLSSEFNPENADDLFLMPQRVDICWSAVEECIKHNAPKVASLIVPPFWQMGPMFYHTCHMQSVPVSVMTPRNLPIARQLIKEAEVDMVVTTADAARELQELLAEEDCGEQIKQWHIVVPEGSRIEFVKVPGTVTYEYFIFPGVSIGKIDELLLEKKVTGIHPSPEYFFEVQDGKCFVTSLRKEALPFIRYELSGKWHEDEGVLVYDGYKK